MFESSSTTSRPLWHRRDVLHAGVFATASLAVAPSWLTNSRRPSWLTPHLVERGANDRVRDLAMRAIDAAKSAGAKYAEARLTRIVSEDIWILKYPTIIVNDDEGLAISVRALVDGGWGFAASPYWNADEADKLGRDAVAQAKGNAKFSYHPIDMGSYPVATGSWETPIEIDPFTISPEEKIDFSLSFEGLAIPYSEYDLIGSASLNEMSFVREERAVATSEGSYFTQVLHRSGSGFEARLMRPGFVSWRIPAGFPDAARRVAPDMFMAGAGWERIARPDLAERIPQYLEEAKQQLSIPSKPVEIGRYDIVMTAASMAQLLAKTLAQATELDRVVGYEANESGTSFLGPDPMNYLGTAVASPLLTVTGDRSMPTGLATVKWDDEGVEPPSTTLIAGGVLQDYQTTREQAAWLAPWYTKSHRPIRSNGCARAESALSFPIQTTPNLSIQPGTADLGLEQLIANTPRGIVFDGEFRMDYQGRSGEGLGGIREITNGKLGSNLVGGVLLIDATQIWKGLSAIGGARSRELFPRELYKGKPQQKSAYTISAVPGVIKNVVVANPMRG